jgi:membrane-bound inhibitor of C-type lysozyme
MKRFLTVALAAALGLATAGMASAVGTYNAGDAAGGISGTRHNLGSLSSHVSNGNTSEICIFCHTPHHTNKANDLQPLWNRGVAAGSFTAYGTTIAGTVVADGDIGSVSLACLSCHDGTTTFDNIVNAPGKGGVTAGGSVQGWSFYDEGTPVTSLFLAGDDVKNIGRDLSNDHPMSVVYNGGSAASLRTTDTVISTIDLTAGLAASGATFDGGNLTKNLWAMKGFISDSATIADLLRGPSANRVECSSCHDPHFDNKSWNEVEAASGGEADFDGLFLRRVGGNTGSGVCRTCHAK